MPVDNRLERIAGMIRQGSIVADIGTDHAHLPVFLIKKGKCQRVYACDVADGPLLNARSNIVGVKPDAIILRKGDGLAAVSPNEADTFVLAGMGGDLIAKIIEAAPWVKDGRYEIIMQPMTSAEDLRQYLCDNGFCILKERAVKSQGRIYTVIKAVFDGQRRECSPLFYHLGLLTENSTADELEYIKRKQRIIKKLADDIKDIETEKERYLKLKLVLDGIEELLEK